ncbi:hypothetical protein GWK47_001360 [Chionoecetes opilio]|uniref:Uncharacterized protein n=1 Tax=Chionoecetes opilio TaxID=41210 RepID=A0A8J5CLW4_CHIOP|nr:hypothetical protein GWK47_001360 [Chionoecetes opilio]
MVLNLVHNVWLDIRDVTAPFQQRGVCTSAPDLGVRRNLLGILAPDVKVTRIIPTNDAVILLTSSDADTYALFMEARLKRLTEGGFTAVMLPELRSSRSVICFRLDELVCEHPPAEIKADLEKAHGWARVEDIYKFPHSKK